jgi:RimJ/RimL family protein N-acetyltransferase
LLATRGIHDPDFMPFAMPWSLEPSPALERNTMQFYWRCRAEMTAANWNINFATIVNGDVVGTSGLFATDFPIVRSFETGSWLGREFQGRGIGQEMRVASLQLGFLGFAAEFATTGAWEDNGPSLGVTAKLGYEAVGHRRGIRLENASTMRRFEMSRADFRARLQRDDIDLVGVEACLSLLGLDQ